MVNILMATYNGEKYLKAQLDSLLSQTFDAWQLFACDDGSSDHTYAILQDYASRDGRIHISCNAQNTGGAKYNFFGLMQRHKSGYVMLCDQDDVWLPEKIERTLQKMHEMEAQFSSDTPILVHTDLKVTDGTLHILSHSYEHYTKANFDNTALCHLLTENIAVGCTVMYNQALAAFVGEMPSFFIMHDFWMAQTAAIFGKVGHVDAPTILYRQHANNSNGAKNFRNLFAVIRLALNIDFLKTNLSNTYLQANSLLQAYEGRLPEAEKALLLAYCSIPSLRKWNRWLMLIRLKTLKHSFLRKVGHFLLV